MPLYDSEYWRKYFEFIRLNILKINSDERKDFRKLIDLMKKDVMILNGMISDYQKRPTVSLKKLIDDKIKSIDDMKLFIDNELLISKLGANELF